jgi:hypothetical protein
MNASRTGQRLLGLEDYLLLAAVLLLPWAFGGVDIWAYRSASFLLVASAAVSFWRSGWAGWGLRRGAGWLLPAFLLAGWAGLQLVPLPPEVLRVVSPSAYRLYEKAFPGYGSEATGSGLTALEERALQRVPSAAPHALPPSTVEGLQLEAPACLEQRLRTISVEPRATAERLAWYCAMLLGFLVWRRRVADSGRYRVYRWALFFLCTALAIFALVQMQLWNGKIYWVRSLLVKANPFGPYFNPTNLAGVMELAVPALVGVAVSRFRRGDRKALHEAGAALAAALLCLIAVFASASKMAAVLVPGGLLVMGFIAAGTLKRRLLLLGGLVVALLLGGLLLSGSRLAERSEEFLHRAEEAKMLGGRLVVWKAGTEMLADFPVTGAGFGTFRQVFQRYVPAGADNRWAHAHNDYLELLLDGGIVAGLLVLWLAVGFGLQVVRGLRVRGELSPTRLGLLVGILLLAVHALVDFNHQVPANGLLWVVFCAMLVPDRDRNPARSGS